MTLRTAEYQWNSFIASLRARADLETAGIILTERLHDRETLLARETIEIPPEGYLIRRRDQLSLDPITLNRILRPARDAGLSVITVHTHPGAERPWFSDADDRGDARLMPSLFHQTPGPHGSVVIAGGTGAATARVWTEPGQKNELAIRTVGRALRTLQQTSPQAEISPWFDRQRLALGREGQATLQGLRVAIIGMGGTGSVAFLQLAHLGVREITAIDGDLVEPSNVSRILGSTANDAGRTLKVDVAARYAKRLGLGTRVRPLNGRLGQGVPLTEIEGCDIVLSCVDTHLPRALLNRLSYDKFLPLIDMGSAFRVDARGKVTAGAGRVVVVGPGRPCLACWGHLDPERIRTESLQETDLARAVADGYIDGAEVQQPSVVAFNTAIAGAAAIELMRLTTQFAGAEDPPSRLSFDFESGTVRRNRLPQAGNCRICLPK